MRRVWLLMVVWVALMGVAQQKADYRKMSRFVREAAEEGVRSRESGVRSLESVGYFEGRSITAFVCISPEKADEVLERHHCRKQAQWGDICIAIIPLSELEALAMEPAVTRIEANQSTCLCVDTTATIVQALPVYESSPSHQAYTGEGVVVGVVDIGFDLIHPNFVDNSSGQSRIRAFWDQLSRDTIGSNLPVGRDYVGTEAITAIRHSTDALTQTHGTHTMGIAAGSGFDTPYRGIAWGSDICVVGNAVNANAEYVDSADYYKYTSATDALAFKYCFDYAEQEGKPCVVSFSEGYPPYLDNEDSLFAATLEQLTGPGRIIVASAGNEGVEMTYFEKRADQREAGSFVRSFKDAALYRIKSEGEMRLAVHMSGDSIAYETAEVPYDTIISRKMVFGEDTLTVSTYRDSSRFSKHDIWQVLLKADSTLNLLPPLAVVVEGQGKIEVYGSSTYAFRDDDIDDRWRAAMKGRNVFAPGCFPGSICVGATTHRLGVLNTQGELMNGSEDTEAGKIAYYSSTGPAMNDLMKPDVVAPGTNMVSSYSHVFYPEWGVVAYSDFEGEHYPWGVQTGTSMSTPVVAGVIALWLQAKPDLTPEEVKEVMRRSCRHPEEKYDYPNDIYGFGEIDAYRGLLEVLSLSGIEGISLHQPKGVEVIPVEGGLRLVFDREVAEPVRVRVYNLSGVCVCERREVDQTTPDRRLLHEDAIAYLGGEVALPNALSGVYVVQVESADRTLQGSTLVRF